MSDLGAVLSLRDESIDPDRLRAFADVLLPGADARICWQNADGAIGLAHAAFWTTPEAWGRAQPVFSDDGQIALIADARLDNREELLRQLPALRERAADLCDAALMLAAYEAWGDDCLQRLCGDFAVILWDGRKRRLLAARDMLGLRPLLYAQMDGCLYLASSLHGLLRALPRRPALNEAAVAHYLAGEQTILNTQTVLAGVQRLEPGHKLVVTRDSVSAPVRYAEWGALPPPLCRTDDDWLEAFRALLIEVLRGHMRVPASTPVGFAVSGGLDSSALACTAHQFLSDSARGRLYSMVFNDMPSADERSFFDQVAERCSRYASTRVPGDGLWAFREYGADGDFELSEPELWAIRGQMTAFYGAAASDGCRVVVWGNGGDLVTGLYVASDSLLWHRMPLRDKVGQVRHYQHFVRRKLTKLLRRPAPDRREHVWSALAPAQQRGLLAWTPPSWPKQPPSGGQDGHVLPTPFAGHIQHRLSAPTQRVLFDLHWRYARHYRIEHRQPYLDRRMIEFAMHLPHRLLYWNGRMRVILRDSMRGVLPEAVRTRRSKVEFSGMIRAGLLRERERIDGLLSHMRLEALGLVDGAAVRRLAEESQLWAAQPGADRRPVPPLASFLSMEAWLRAYGY
jgi:asparagine synthase (glutamine-hydrolysing)